MDVKYLCDGKDYCCETNECFYGPHWYINGIPIEKTCRHTMDLKHAINFKPTINGYEEVGFEEPDSSSYINKEYFTPESNEN